MAFLTRKGYLTRKQILQIEDLGIEDVDVPEWGGTVRIRGLTGTERDAFEATVVQQDGRKTIVDMHNMRAKLVALCAVDEKGERLFNDGDIEALGRKSAAALDRCFDAAQRLSGLSDEDIEELAKNLEVGQSDGSPSG